MIWGESNLQCSFYFAVWTHFSFCLVGLTQEIELIVCSLIFDYTEQIPGHTSLLGCSPRTCGVIALCLWCWTLWYDLHKPMPFQWRQLWKASISCCCVLFFSITDWKWSTRSTDITQFFSFSGGQYFSTVRRDLEYVTCSPLNSLHLQPHFLWICFWFYLCITSSLGGHCGICMMLLMCFIIIWS